MPVSFAVTGPIAKALGARNTLIWAGVVGGGVITPTALLVPWILAPERDGSLAAGRSAEPP